MSEQPSTKRLLLIIACSSSTKCSQSGHNQSMIIISSFVLSLWDIFNDWVRAHCYSGDHSAFQISAAIQTSITPPSLSLSLTSSYCLMFSTSSCSGFADVYLSGSQCLQNNTPGFRCSIELVTPLLVPVLYSHLVLHQWERTVDWEVESHCPKWHNAACRITETQNRSSGPAPYAGWHEWICLITF